MTFNDIKSAIAGLDANERANLIDQLCNDYCSFCGGNSCFCFDDDDYEDYDDDCSCEECCYDDDED